MKYKSSSGEDETEEAPLIGMHKTSWKTEVSVASSRSSSEQNNCIHGVQNDTYLILIYSTVQKAWC